MVRRRLHAGFFLMLIPVAIRLYSDEQHLPNVASSQEPLAAINLNATKHTGDDNAVEADIVLNKSTRSNEQRQSNPHGSNNNTSSSPLSSSDDTKIDMNDLNSSKKATCGFIKCYFRSKSNSQVGYVVAPMSKKTRGRLKSLTRAWEFGKELRRDYNIQHFLLAPPTTAVVSKNLYSTLNQNLFSERSQKIQKRTRFRKGSTIVVQKVQAAPKQRLLLGCARPKLRILHKQLDNFIRKEVLDVEMFARRFNETFTQARELLRHEPCLIDDFQVFVDATGEVYHLDLDRCFNAKTTKKKNTRLDRMVKTQCYKSLDKIERNVYAALKNSGLKK